MDEEQKKQIEAIVEKKIIERFDNEGKEGEDSTEKVKDKRNRNNDFRGPPTTKAKTDYRLQQNSRKNSSYIHTKVQKWRVRKFSGTPQQALTHPRD